MQFPVDPVLGYVDPSSSSALLQVLLAAAVGALAAVKVYWTSLKLFAGRVFSRKSSRDEQDAS